jgi:hypothetical protein
MEADQGPVRTCCWPPATTLRVAVPDAWNFVREPVLVTPATPTIRVPVLVSLLSENARVTVAPLSAPVTAPLKTVFEAPLGELQDTKPF